MPLLRTVARTAVIAGTATHVSNNVSRRQGERWQRQAGQGQMVEQPQAASAGVPEVDPIERLKELGALHDQGILTDEEFAAQKSKILSATG
jgi:Short C-terminal domain